MWSRFFAAFVALVALSGSACSPCDETPGSLCRLAGTGASGFNGDGLAPRDTDFYQVSAARRGPDGRLYVMDFNNHRLRRVSSEDRVETVAGDGEHDFASLGVPPTESSLENPVDFAFAPDGSLHLVMLHDPRVLRIGGTLEVVAGTERLGDGGDGGPALSAQFTQLAGIAFAADGTMYLADELTHRVRVVRPDGTVDLVAGTGTPGYSGDGAAARLAQLDSPRGLAVSPAGDLFIADAGNHAVRRVRASDGVIETFAGNGTGGFSGDGGQARQAQLRRPAGVAISPEGELYVADTENQRVRRVSVDGIITTVAGNGTRGSDGENGPAVEAQLSGPYGVDFDGDSRLLIAELRGGRVSVLHLLAP